MDIEKAKGTCKAYINAIDTFGTINYKCINNLYEPIETVLSELEKKEKQIDLMAEQLAGLAIFDIEKDEPLVLGDKEEVKEYFTKKAEKEGK